MGSKINDMTRQAFKHGKTLKIQNTKVIERPVTKDGAKTPGGHNWLVVELHGNQIARKDMGTGHVEINTQNYQTDLTKGRLQAVGADIVQKDWDWYLNGYLMPLNGWVSIDYKG